MADHNYYAGRSMIASAGTHDGCVVLGVYEVLQDFNATEMLTDFRKIPVIWESHEENEKFIKFLTSCGKIKPREHQELNTGDFGDIEWAINNG